MNLHASLLVFFAFSTATLNARAQLRFSQACDRGRQTSIAAVGDIIAHQPLQAQALQSSAGFRTLWQNVESLLNKASVTYANLESPVAERFALSNAPFSFNFHKRVIRDLKSSGFDVVSTANNHALDRGTAGIDQTIEALNAENLAFSGTYHSNGTTRIGAITQSNGITLAWLACTDLSNSGFVSQLQSCRSNSFLNAITQYQSSQGIDGVIVTPHWGDERATSPSGSQRGLAQAFFNAGAIAVIGAHPHVLQKWEKWNVAGKDRLVVYSLGNFVSNQLYYGTAQRTSVIMYLGFTKTSRGLVINGARFTPIFMTRDPYFSAYATDTQPGLATFRRHTFSFFDAPNELLPGQKLITNPECD